MKPLFPLRILLMPYDSFHIATASASTLNVIIIIQSEAARREINTCY